MNLNVAVVGAARSGKSLFCINFAEYLGARSLCYTEDGPHGRGRGVITPEQARKLMVWPGSRTNGIVRTFAVNRLNGKPLRIAFTDTTALHQEEPLPKRERLRLLFTLQAIRNADFIIHLIDLTCSDPSRLDFVGKIHRSLALSCSHCGQQYLPLGSKCDLLQVMAPAANVLTPGLGRIEPVSSLTREGFARIRQRLLAKANGLA